MFARSATGPRIATLDERMEAGMLKVQDIMSPGALVFTPETPLAQATDALIENNIGGAPVVHAGRVIGVLSKTDLLDRGRAAETVGEAMTPLVFYVRADEPAMTAVRLMRAEGIHRVIVVKGQGVLAGIVTTTDVLRALERGQSFHEGDALQASLGRHADPASAT